MLMLDELWYGNMTFESHTAGDKEYKKETKKLCEMSDKFLPMLSEEQRKAFNELSDQQLSVYAISEKDAFITGVRFGVEFMLDVLCNIELNFS